MSLCQYLLFIYRWGSEWPIRKVPLFLEHCTLLCPFIQRSSVLEKRLKIQMTKYGIVWKQCTELQINDVHSFTALVHTSHTNHIVTFCPPRHSHTHTTPHLSYGWVDSVIMCTCRGDGLSVCDRLCVRVCQGLWMCHKDKALALGLCDCVCDCVCAFQLACGLNTDIDGVVKTDGNDWLLTGYLGSASECLIGCLIANWLESSQEATSTKDACIILLKHHQTKGNLSQN